MSTVDWYNAATWIPLALAIGSLVSLAVFRWRARRPDPTGKLRAYGPIPPPPPPKQRPDDQ